MCILRAWYISHNSELFDYVWAVTGVLGPQLAKMRCTHGPGNEARVEVSDFPYVFNG